MTRSFGSLSITDRILPINMLVLFSAFLFLQIRFLNPVQRLLDRLGLSTLSQSDDFRSKIFVWVGAGLIGGSYFIPAINKILILWPFREQLQYYIPSKYLWGWLTFLDTETMLELYSVMQVLNPIAVFSTIVIETAAVFLMWRRNISIVIISSFVFLHTTIFVLSGIAFWKWIIVDIAFLLFIVLVDKSDQSNVFDQKTVIVVTLLIVFSPIIIQTAPLGWYTNNYDARYTIETVSESGEIKDVHWSEMDPYVYTFSSSRFEYIYDGQSISGVAQNWTMTSELRSSTSKEDVRLFKQT